MKGMISNRCIHIEWFEKLQNFLSGNDRSWSGKGRCVDGVASGSACSSKLGGGRRMCTRCHVCGFLGRYISSYVVLVDQEAHQQKAEPVVNRLALVPESSWKYQSVALLDVNGGIQTLKVRSSAIIV